MCRFQNTQYVDTVNNNTDAIVSNLDNPNKNNIDKHIRAKFYQGSCTKIRNHSKKVSSSM